MYLDLFVLSDKRGDGGERFSQVGVVLTEQVSDQLRHSNGGLYDTITQGKKTFIHLHI